MFSEYSAVEKKQHGTTQHIKAPIAVRNYTYINCYWLYFGIQKLVLNQLNGVGRFKKELFLIWSHAVAKNSVTTIMFYLRFLRVVSLLEL